MPPPRVRPVGWWPPRWTARIRSRCATSPPCSSASSSPTRSCTPRARWSSRSRSARTGPPCGCATPAVESAELVVEDRPLGTLEMRGHGPLDADGRAFVALAADRIALIVAEHGLLHADRARSQELDFLAEATDLLTRSLSVSLNLALVTQLVVPRLGDWFAAFPVVDRRRARRVTADHRHDGRTAR